MTANHETYLLMANTQNDMEDWVKTIRRVIWAPFGGGQYGSPAFSHLCPRLMQTQTYLVVLVTLIIHELSVGNAVVSVTIEH